MSFLIPFLVILMVPVLIVIQIFTLPSGWKRSRRQRRLILLYGLLSLGFFLGMIFAPRLGLSPAVREVFNYGTLGLLCLTFSTIAVFCLRYLLVYALLRMRVWPAIRVLVKK